MTDASDEAVVAALQQYVKDTWHSISFLSKKFKPAETRYSALNRELLAIYLAIKHFDTSLMATSSMSSLNTMPLTYALQTCLDRLSPRQARKLDFILEFTSTRSTDTLMHHSHRSSLLMLDSAWFTHIDLVGLLPPPQRFTYLLTCVDKFTRWPESIPFIPITAEDVAQAFLSGWIALLGLPTTIVTDRGVVPSTDVSLGIQRAHTTAYHPQSNGLVERFHRQLKDQPFFMNGSSTRGTLGY